MKEYKVVQMKLGLRNRIKNLEDILNQYAREGWRVVEIPSGWQIVVFERDKNR